MTQMIEFFSQGGIAMLLIAAVSITAWVFALGTWRTAKYLLDFLEHNKPEKDHRVIYENELTRLNGKLSFLSTLAAALPLLGLLGTVLGMLVTFHVICRHGTGQPSLLANGIRQALLTTQAGLFSAIPVLFFHHLISSCFRKIDSKLNIVYHELHTKSKS
jgi:biopolymer transport protein ExbB/TolQ